MMLGLPSLGIVLSACLLSAQATNSEGTRRLYTVRSPNVDRERRAVEIIDLGNFLLTNSEDGRPKEMAPFYLTIAETREELSDVAIKKVEDATSEFLLQELGQVTFSWDFVENVQTKIVRQERVVEEVEGKRKLGEQSFRGRNLLSVPGSKLEVHVNVTFDREPSPDAAEVDESLQRVMQNLTYLVDNITATADPELGYVFMAYREEISTANENPTTVADIQVPQTDPKASEQSMKFIIPILVGLVIMGAIITLFVVKRRRRRVQAANQKAQEDLAFLDEETNVFSFENSPTKSSARKRAYDIDTNEYDAEGDASSSQYSASQGSNSQTSPSYAMISGIGSPTARSSISGASTVKASNARLMPLPSKLTELASTSLFAFSEEEEDYEDSTEEGNSQKTPKSPTNLQQPSDLSMTSSFNRIMNGKTDEEAISSNTSSPRHGVTSPGSTSLATTPTGQPKSSISSFFSSHFFSGGDSVSQFDASAMTVQVANTSEEVKKKAAKQGIRSFSLSPRRFVDKSNSPDAGAGSRAKSEAGGDDESTDSVFDFVATSPKSNNDGEQMTASGTTSAADGAGTEKAASDANATSVVATPTSAAPSTGPSSSATAALAAAAGTAILIRGANETAAPTSSSTPPTVMKSNVSSKGKAKDISDDSDDAGINLMNPMRYLKKVGMTPRSQTQTTQTTTNPQANLRHYTPDAQDILDDMSEEDSLSDTPGSFPRRNRRHAKSTTRDGTFAYQTNAMQPQDWSMTDGASDDDTLSEQGAGGTAFGAFPKTGFRSPASTSKKAERVNEPMSPSNQSKSSYSAVTQTSAASKADSSQASASRQLINDLVWLSKKIAGVKQSAVDSAPGEVSALGAPPQIETVDSLSYASQDGLISPTSAAQGAPSVPTPTSVAGSPRKSLNTNIVCRDCHAPPGKLNIVIHSTKDGPAVHEVKDGSCLEGRIYPGDLIIAVDDIDTRAFTAAQLMKTMAEKSRFDRKITVLHFEEKDEEAKTKE